MQTTGQQGAAGGEERLVAAITGAGSGIGRALAIRLAEQGADLALADIAEANLNATLRSLEHTEAKVSTRLLDVSDRAAVVDWAQEVVASFGHVNMIFNNAGVTVVDNVENISIENFRWLMDTNFWSQVHCTQAFLPYLKQAHRAHIINTSSIFGVVAAANQAAYNASKFAVRGFTEALQQELAETHIKVSCVLPGGVKTNIVGNARYYVRDNESVNQEEATERFKQNAGLQPEQAADIILKGIDGGESHILVGRDAKMLALAQRLAPTGYPWFMRLMARFMGGDLLRRKNG